MVTINPDTLFTLEQVASMTGVSLNRVQTIVYKGYVPYTRTRGDKGQYRVRFGDLEAVSEADQKIRRAGVNRKTGSPTFEAFNALEARVTALENLFDTLTSPDLADSTPHR